MKILLLEDEYTYRLTIKEYLESLHFEVADFENGNEALDEIFRQHFDLLLMDIRVPGIDGYEITKVVRKEKLDVPIILVTSLTDIDNLSIGYEMGCNDYIRKPFELRELKYRVLQTINQAHFKTSQNLLKLSYDFHADLENYTLYHHDKMVELTKTETKTLFTLIRYADTYVSIHKLIDDVWENKEILGADVRMCIKRIRDKTDKRLIQCSRGLGYRIEKS